MQIQSQKTTVNTKVVRSQFIGATCTTQNKSLNSSVNVKIMPQRKSKIFTTFRCLLYHRNELLSAKWRLSLIKPGLKAVNFSLVKKGQDKYNSSIRALVLILKSLQNYIQTKRKRNCQQGLKYTLKSPLKFQLLTAHPRRDNRNQATNLNKAKLKWTDKTDKTLLSFVMILKFPQKRQKAL